MIEELLILGLLGLLSRIAYVLLNHGKIIDKNDSKQVKTLIILGSGGHTTEMIKILKYLNLGIYQPRIYIHASSDKMSVDKLAELEKDSNKNFKVLSIFRSREVGQSYLTSIFSTLFSFFSAFKIVWKENPDLILANGPGTCVPLCLSGFVLKCLFISKCQIILIESFCRVKTFSLTTKILYYFCDHLIVQWSELYSKTNSKHINMSKAAPLISQSIPWDVLLQTCCQEVLPEMKEYLTRLCKVLESSDRCFDADWIDNNLLRLEICLDRTWEKLNTGHWKDVAIETRHTYTICSVLKCILLEISGLGVDEKVWETKVEEIFEQIDKGLLLGAPLDQSPDLLTTIASNWSEKLKKKELKDTKVSFQFDEENLSKELLPGMSWIQRYKTPTMQTFYQKMFMPKVPGVLEGCIEHWKALTAWKDPNYLIKVAGMRTVPIELGSRYTEEDWSQHLLTFSKFIQSHVIQKGDSVGYLAQHQLFEQIPELKNDFAIPDYCLFSDCSSESPPDVNAWFGPKGTVSPLHFDPKNNLLCQVFGYKLVILYHPDNKPNLYPFETKLLNNTAQVDPVNPDFEKYPDFKKSKGTMCYLGPGEMLFLPPKWWHYVASLTPSFSISFWWE